MSSQKQIVGKFNPFAKSLANGAYRQKRILPKKGAGSYNRNKLTNPKKYDNVVCG